MTAEFPHPPASAEAILRLLLPRDSRDTVSGDLLEEYRETRLPAVGQSRANVWYLRQLAGTFLRAYWWFGLPLALLLITHDLFNTFRDPSGALYAGGLAMALFPAPLFAVFLLVGAYGGWRTGQWRGGLLAALGTYLVTWTLMALWWNVTFYPFAQYQQTNPYWIQAWHFSDSPGETFVHWIFWDNVGALLLSGILMLLLSVVLGSIGGALGTLTTPLRQRLAR